MDISKEIDQVANDLQLAGGLQAEVVFWALQAAYEQGLKGKHFHATLAMDEGLQEWVK